MQNEASFHIIGRIANEPVIREKVAFVTIASNRNYKDDSDKWQKSTQFSQVAFFRNLEWAEKLSKGDLVRIEGDIASTKRSVDGNDVYATELHARRQAVLAPVSGSSDD